MEQRKEAVLKNLKFPVKDEIRVAVAPGRVNLIGEHTDYNMGFVLPCAVDKDMMVAAVPNETDTINLYSMNLDNSISFSLKDLQFNASDGWINYAKGICFYLLEKGYNIGGIDGVLHGTVPIGSGMSSSAALEVSIGYIFHLLFNLNIPPLDLIKIAFLAENQFMGVACGIMDQYVSVRGVENNFLFIDCKSLDYEAIELQNQGIQVVILHTNVKRAAASALNKRKNECLEAVSLFQKYDPSINALRDVSVDFFEKQKKNLPPILSKRVQHVVYENQRVLDAKKALKANDLDALGTLMYKSHKSLAELYEVSIKELDTMVEIARNAPGVIGARMMGAGLGGAVVCLVEQEHVDKLISEVFFRYPKLTNKQPLSYVCKISDGVREI
ncbi:MAG TPA: galactokinase [Candidatus Deferrimicrobium sp.]|nr:galactokinase [Candidatus Deferrimicrobium sp.]